MAANKVLVPLSLTGNEKKALDFVVNKFLSGDTVEITLFHAYARVPEIDADKDPIMGKIIKNLSYQRQLLAEQGSELQLVRRGLMEKGFTPDRVHCLFTPIKQNIPRDIIQLVLSKGFDSVVLSRIPGSIAGFFTRSTSKQVTAELGDKVDVFVIT